MQTYVMLKYIAERGLYAAYVRRFHGPGIRFPVAR